MLLKKNENKQKGGQVSNDLHLIFVQVNHRSEPMIYDNELQR